MPKAQILPDLSSVAQTRRAGFSSTNKRTRLPAAPAAPARAPACNPSYQTLRTRPSPFIIPAKAHNAAIGQSDAGWARMVTWSGLGPCSFVFWWRRRLRGSRAGSWARGRLRCALRGRLRCELRGRLRCQLRGRLSALSESARTHGQQSSKKKYRRNQRRHGVLLKLPAPLHFSIISIC